MRFLKLFNVFFNTIRNKIVSYIYNVNNTNTDHISTYENNLGSQNSANSKYLNYFYGDIITGDIRMIEN